ncbi:MAG: hypothetical protein ACI8PZ_001268 [Myxococcota bacterium]
MDNALLLFMLACTAGPRSKGASDTAGTVATPGSGATSSTGATTSTGDPTTPTGTGSSTGDTAGPEALLRVLGEPFQCTDPGARESARFDTVVVDTVDVSYIYDFGGGVSWLELDGDPDLELIRTTESGWRLYDRTLVGWEEVTADRVPPQADTPVAAVTGADIDGDLDLDLLVLAFDGPTVLLRNDGGSFTDITAGSGLQATDHDAQTGAWGDVDGDGDLDLFIGTYGEVPATLPSQQAHPAQLYLSHGDGTFEDVSDTLPPEVHGGYSFQGTWVDVDDDGDADLIVTNDFPFREPNFILRNDGTLPLLVDIDAGFGVGVSGMGTAVADLDGDTRPDFVLSALEEVAVLLATDLPEGGVGYLRTDDAWGIRPLLGDPDLNQRFGWGVAVEDLDNDGPPEILVRMGDTVLEPLPFDPEGPYWNAQPDGLWVQSSPGVWTDEAAAWGVADTGLGRGLVVADHDGDGWLDLLTADLNGPTRVLTARCGASRAAAITLRDDRSPNRHAIGARLTVTNGPRTSHHWVLAGGTSLFSAGPTEVHVGVGEAATVDVLVRWPDGESTLEADVPTGRRVTLIRPP